MPIDTQQPEPPLTRRHRRERCCARSRRHSRGSIPRARLVPRPLPLPKRLEATFAITWLSWPVANLLSPDALTERPALTILNVIGGWLWPWVGFVLFPWQIAALRLGNLRQRAMVQTMGYGILLHVTVCVGAMSLDPFSPMITLFLALTTIAGILSWRLWRRYA